MKMKSPDIERGRVVPTKTTQTEIGARPRKHDPCVITAIGLFLAETGKKQGRGSRTRVATFTGKGAVEVSNWEAFPPVITRFNMEKSDIIGFPEIKAVIPWLLESAFPKLLRTLPMEITVEIEHQRVRELSLSEFISLKLMENTFHTGWHPVGVALRVMNEMLRIQRELGHSAASTLAEDPSEGVTARDFYGIVRAVEVSTFREIVGPLVMVNIYLSEGDSLAVADLVSEVEWMHALGCPPGSCLSTFQPLKTAWESTNTNGQLCATANFIRRAAVLMVVMRAARIPGMIAEEDGSTHSEWFLPAIERGWLTVGRVGNILIATVEIAMLEVLAGNVGERTLVKYAIVTRAIEIAEMKLPEQCFYKWNHWLAADLQQTRFFDEYVRVGDTTKPRNAQRACRRVLKANYAEGASLLTARNVWVADITQAPFTLVITEETSWLVPLFSERVAKIPEKLRWYKLYGAHTPSLAIAPGFHPSVRTSIADLLTSSLGRSSDTSHRAELRYAELEECVNYGFATPLCRPTVSGVNSLLHSITVRFYGGRAKMPAVLSNLDWKNSVLHAVAILNAKRAVVYGTKDWLASVVGGGLAEGNVYVPDSSAEMSLFKEVVRSLAGHNDACAHLPLIVEEWREGKAGNIVKMWREASLDLNMLPGPAVILRDGGLVNIATAPPHPYEALVALTEFRKEDVLLIAASALVGVIGWSTSNERSLLSLIALAVAVGGSGEFVPLRDIVRMACCHDVGRTKMSGKMNGLTVVLTTTVLSVLKGSTPPVRYAVAMALVIVLFVGTFQIAVAMVMVRERNRAVQSYHGRSAGPLTNLQFNMLLSGVPVPGVRCADGSNPNLSPVAVAEKKTVEQVSIDGVTLSYTRGMQYGIVTDPTVVGAKKTTDPNNDTIITIM